MQDIRIYDFEANLLHIEHDIVSSNWKLEFNDIGTWEGHFSINSPILPAIMEVNQDGTLKHPYLVAIQDDKQAIITSKQINTEFILYGRTCNWILTRRTIPKFDVSTLGISTNVEAIARWAVGQSFSDTPVFALGDVVGFATPQAFVRDGASLLFDTVKECLALDNAGHKVFFDVINNRWTFTVLKRATITYPSVISEANLTAYETNYDENLLQYFTGGYYEATTEGVTETTPTYISGDNSKTGIYKWNTVLAGANESEAKDALLQKKWEKELQAKIRDLKYGVDYNLGDRVRVQKQIGEWSATFEKVVTGVSIWFENNNSGEQPVFADE